MFSYLYIEGDATVWTLEKPIDATRISESEKTLALTLANPLKGTLLLSARAGSVELFSASGMPLQPAGWIPGEVTLPFPCLYLPSVSIPANGPVLYGLSAATAAALPGQLTTAMNEGTKITVPFTWGTGTGEMVLNGAVLPFAVIAMRLPDRFPPATRRGRVVGAAPWSVRPPRA
jgi:hypothetical protein